MSDVQRLILADLVEIRGEFAEFRVEQRAQRMRLGAIERSLALITRDRAEFRTEIDLRFERVLDRLDRIGARMKLVSN